MPFEFVLGAYSADFERAALDNGGCAFSADLEHLFRTGRHAVANADAKDQLRSHLKRLPGWAPGAFIVCYVELGGGEQPGPWRDGYVLPRDAS